MNVFIGLDVSLASTAIYAVSESGKILQAVSADSEPEALVRALGQIEGSIASVGLEAGPLSQWLHKHLSDAGFNTVLLETRHVKGVLKALPINTDRRDAEGIARLLHMGWFRPVHCKSISAQETRALLTTRKALQQSVMNLESSVRGVLRNFGLKIGSVTKQRFEARVRELADGNMMLEAAVDAILASRRALREQYSEVDTRLVALAKGDAVCELMMSMPGVGAIIALTVKSAIDDPERFKSSKDVGPWSGLTPKRSQSGEMDIVGHITKAGDASLRAALYQAATVMLNIAKPNWLSAWALRVAHRRGKKRATTALARRICVVLHRMWRDGRVFATTRERAMSTKLA